MNEMIAAEWDAGQNRSTCLANVSVRPLHSKAPRKDSPPIADIMDPGTNPVYQVHAEVIGVDKMSRRHYGHRQ